MSTTDVDISYDLVEGIFTVLDGNVTYNAVTYPVYKSIPKTPPVTYVIIGDVLQDEDGTKDSFIYYGTVQVIVVNESMQRADKKLAQNILNVVRGLLKATRAVTFATGARTLITFRPGPTNDMVVESDTGISSIRKIQTYYYLIE